MVEIEEMIFVKKKLAKNLLINPSIHSHTCINAHTHCTPNINLYARNKRENSYWRLFYSKHFSVGWKSIYYHFWNWYFAFLFSFLRSSLIVHLNNNLNPCLFRLSSRHDDIYSLWIISVFYWNSNWYTKSISLTENVIMKISDLYSIQSLVRYCSCEKKTLNLL